MHKFVKYTLDETLVDGDDILLVGEGHFKVDLRELGLTVGAEVLIAEAAGDLEIAVKAGIHQKLLIKLR